MGRNRETDYEEPEGKPEAHQRDFNLMDPNDARAYLRDARWPDGTPLESLTQADGKLHSLLENPDKAICFLAIEIEKQSGKHLHFAKTEVH